MTDLWTLVTALAERQLGLVSSRDLARLGAPRTLSDSWVRMGRLTVERRRVYRVAGTPGGWSTRVLAAVLAAGPPAVASHLTGAAIWGLAPTIREAAPAARLEGSRLHLTTARQVRLRGVVVHRRQLPAIERSRVGCIPVTSLERTLLDLAELLDPDALGRCVDEAIRRGAHLESLERLVSEHPSRGRARRWPIRQVIAARLPGFDPGANVWEREMDDSWDALGLPPAQRQFAVTACGRRYVLDRAIPDLRIGIEWNGFAYHGRRSNFDRDSYRRADLMAEGWELVEVTSTWTPERLCRVVMAVVERRRHEIAGRQGRDGLSPRSGSPSRAR